MEPRRKDWGDLFAFRPEAARGDCMVSHRSLRLVRVRGQLGQLTSLGLSLAYPVANCWSPSRDLMAQLNESIPVKLVWKKCPVLSAGRKSKRRTSVRVFGADLEGPGTPRGLFSTPAPRIALLTFASKTP